MFKQHIHNLKQKPHHVRRRYAATYTTIIMVVIVSIWISSFTFSGSLKNIEAQAVSTGISTAVSTENSNLGANSFSVWKIIKDSVSSVWQGSASYKSSDTGSTGNVIVTGANANNIDKR